MEGFDTERWAARRRPLDKLERDVVRLFVDRGDERMRPVLSVLRYALSFARLTHVRTCDGADVEVAGPVALHAQWVQRTLSPRIADADSVGALIPFLEELTARTQQARRSLLAHTPVDRDALEAEVTQRLWVVASGGGGGAGYVYPGVYQQLERSGLVPDLMVGTSIGALMSLFRARRRRYDFAPLVSAARRLSWGGVFQVLETTNRYGLPATLRLKLRNALGTLFERDDGEPMQIGDMQIPLLIVATGITVDALKHDLDYYEHLLDDDVRRSGIRAGLAGIAGTLKAIGVVREFTARRDSLRCIVLGRDPGTTEFDVLDAAGFSAAVPAVIHYDVLRHDPRMHRILGNLYGGYGITRLGEGGLTSNVPARAAWETATAGLVGGRRNAFVLALDCFAPNPRRLAWFPFQQLVRAANVNAERRFADLYVAHSRTLSPMNLVPSLRDAMTAVRWGREAIRGHMPFVREMCSPLDVLADA
ncbi:MAG: patatin-like phospholipase family protein [Myxococcales bacterium]|nr:patatin-like phospholipase family protein [Myxococcales bacterium]